MKVTDIIGKKVLDGNAYNLGKIQDLDIDIKENIIKKIYISPNEISLKKVVIEIDKDMISEVGDYMLLNVPKSEIVSENKETPDAEVVDPDELEKRSKL